MSHSPIETTAPGRGRRWLRRIRARTWRMARHLGRRCNPAARFDRRRRALRGGDRPAPGLAPDAARAGLPSCPRKTARLIGDCEAFLTGRYPLRLRKRHRWEWAWINTLAHGCPEDVAALSCPDDDGLGAASFAACEVLINLERYRWDLGWLQREYLVPLELECMAGRYRTAAGAAARLVEVLRSAHAETRGRPLRSADPEIASAGVPSQPTRRS